MPYKSLVAEPRKGSNMCSWQKNWSWWGQGVVVVVPLGKLPKRKAIKKYSIPSTMTVGLVYTLNLTLSMCQPLFIL